MSDDCVFCSIAAGSIPSEFVLETDQVVAFRDISPAAPVHVLVIPKRHVADVAELARDPELTAAVMRAVSEVAAGQNLTDYRVVFNTGPSAGQSVFHAHAHVLGGRDLTWPPG